MSDRKYKEGQQVIAEAVQLAEDGTVLSEVSVKWFGFENDEANAASMALVQSVFQTADGWRVMKAQGQKLAGDVSQAEPAQVKQPGAIR